MAKQKPDLSDIPTEELLRDFKEISARLDEVLEDLKWRKPDVEAEERKLKALQEKKAAGECVETRPQEIILRVAKAVLQDKIREAEKLEAAMTVIEEELKRREEGKKRAEKPHGEEA